jgi:hypothetical protein
MCKVGEVSEVREVNDALGGRHKGHLERHSRLVGEDEMGGDATGGKWETHSNVGGGGDEMVGVNVGGGCRGFRQVATLDVRGDDGRRSCSI